MYKRKTYLEKIRPYYNDRNIKILVGIRRCGKSYLLEQIIADLKKQGIKSDHIIHVNYETVYRDDLLDYKALHAFVEEQIKDKSTYYLFLDEIQQVDNFAHTINSLRVTIKNLSIFITGSNSKLLPSELPTELSGRYIGFRISPFSYKEYTEYTKQEGASEKVFWEYAKWGGLPNVADYQKPAEKEEYLSYVFDSIVLRDIVERLSLKNVLLFEQLVGYLLETVGREFSLENVLNYLKSSGREVAPDTIYAYLDALQKALLIEKVYRFDLRGKAVLKTLNKYYLTDLGLATIKNTNPEIDDAYILENIVFNELKNRGYKVYIGKTDKGEIDFYATKFEEKLYVQVAATLKDATTREREFGAFSTISDNHPKLILSLDSRDYSRDGIKHQNLLEWLLNSPKS
ncbi:ATP-binding protein [Candidatus Saccharibacteria bacterium]|nr:ATP-binding protein [Candidatus Saccharibacteria bacterium]